jgi:putative transposase
MLELCWGSLEAHPNVRGFLTTEVAVNQLRQAFKDEMARRPFIIDAIVILPDHIHSIWTLPKDDADYSIRGRNIKRTFTQQIAPYNRPAVFASRRHKGEQAIWQRRFLRHKLRTGLGTSDS